MRKCRHADAAEDAILSPRGVVVVLHGALIASAALPNPEEEVVVVLVRVLMTGHSEKNKLYYYWKFGIDILEMKRSL